MGLALVALLISYLPTIYGAFSRRELLVSMLEVRADSPPSPVVMLTRMHRLHGLDALHPMWERWEQWFAEVEESHSSLPVLVYYRSQQPSQSWVNAAGAIMDAAALTRSAVAIPMESRRTSSSARGTSRSGGSATSSGSPTRPIRGPTDATSIDRARFEHAFDVLAEAGVPMVADRDQGMARLQRLARELRRPVARARAPHDGAGAVVGPADALGVRDRRADADRTGRGG